MNTSNNNNFTGGDYEIKLIKNILKKKLKNKFESIILNGGGENYGKLKEKITKFTTELIQKLRAIAPTQISTIADNIKKSLITDVDKTIDVISVIIKDTITKLNVDEIVSLTTSGATSQYVTAPLADAGKAVTSFFGKKK